MVTLETGSKSIYAKNNESSLDLNDNSKSYDSKSSLTYQSGSGTGGKPVVVGENYPIVRGVAVVASGADSSVVREKIITLVTSVLNISANKVCVTY